VTIHAKQAGEGEPLVLIHGLFGSLENLGGIARLLAEDFAVHSLDLPNHGRSKHTSAMSLASMAADVLAWMDEQGLEQAHMLGHSLGGKVAMEVALTHPERVASLVVVDIAPVTYSPHHNDVFKGLLAVDPAQIESRAEADKALKPYVPELPVRSFLLKNLVKEPDGGFAWRMNLPVINQEYEQLIAANRADARYPGPTLFVKGGDSHYIQEKHREDIISRFPQAAVRIVPETGHWLHAEKPELVARLVKRFVAAE
jgi:esterase